MRRKIAMLHKRQAPGRDIHKHFDLAPARSHAITAGIQARATKQAPQATGARAIECRSAIKLDDSTLELLFLTEKFTSRAQKHAKTLLWA